MAAPTPPIVLTDPPEAEPPAASFYRRPLPEGQIAFASPEGRELFREALAAGHMESWFALSEQFHTQADPAFCGLGTLVVVLNALEIDPGRIWKGPWRWYGEDLLDCCLPLEKVRQKGITLDELACLARCNGAAATTVRAHVDQPTGDQATSPTPANEPHGHDVTALRAAVRAATSAARGPVVVAAYARAAMGQTGGGHFSPIAGYHPGRDLALVLDVARFKYPPHWVSLPLLWQAMTAVDPATGKPRGWMVLQRGPQRAQPVYFRLTAVDGLTELVSSLLDEAPALLATVATDSPRALVQGWVHAVETRLAAPVRQALQTLTTPTGLPPEHQRLIDTLLRELRATTAYQYVRSARAADNAGEVPDDVLAVLLLALPEVAVARLPAAVTAALEILRRPSALGATLTEEIAALRDQMFSLRQWSCGR